MPVNTARNVWVDYAKAIGIILVVYGHVARGVFNAGLINDRDLYKLVDSVIYSFHMPLFFFLSGIFFLASLAKRDSISFLLGKVDTIFYPYVVWSLLQGGVAIVLSHYLNTHTSLSEVLSFAWLPRAQFWFLYVLFFVFAFALLVYRRSDYRWSIVVFAGSICLYLFGGLLPGSYIIFMLSHNFVYFAAGVVAAFLLQKFAGCSLMGLILFASLFVLSQWIFQVGGEFYFEAENGAVKLLLGLIGIGLVVFFAQWLAQYNLPWLAYLGRHSMTIYLVHILAGSGCRVILQYGLGVTNTTIQLLLGTLGGLLLPLLFYLGCNRFGLGWLFKPPKLLSVSN